MDDAAYVAAYGHWQKSIPFREAGEYNKTQEALIEAASPEHKPMAQEVSYFTDQVRCACGWESDKFWDGMTYAYKQWRKHVMDVIADE